MFAVLGAILLIMSLDSNDGFIVSSGAALLIIATLLFLAGLAGVEYTRREAVVAGAAHYEQVTDSNGAVSHKLVWHGKPADKK